MKLKNVTVGQRVQIKDLTDEVLVRYGHNQHKLAVGAILECTNDGLDDDGHVRLCTTDGLDYFYYTLPSNLRKVK